MDEKTLKFRRTIASVGKYSITLSSIPKELLEALKLEVGDEILIALDYSDKHKQNFIAFWKAKQQKK